MSKNVRFSTDTQQHRSASASKMGHADAPLVTDGLTYVESKFKSPLFLRDETTFGFHDEIDPPRRSCVDIAPPRLSVADVDPPRRSCGNIAPPRLSFAAVDPPRRSCGNIAPPRLSFADVDPPRRSCGNIAPPRLSSAHVDPPRRSCGNIAPPRLSSVGFEAPRLSSGDVAPPRTSFSTHISIGLLNPWNHIGREEVAETEREESSESNPTISYILSSQMNKSGGHIFSLAAADGILYTGSDSNTVRAWRFSRPEFVESSRLDSGSGMVRAILLRDDKVFSAHADCKIRVWRRSRSNPGIHKRWATIPTLIDSIHRWMKPKSKVLGWKQSHESNPVVKHTGEISSLAYHDGFLYSGSWDKTVKVWRMSDLKCMETIEAHEDAVNAIVVSPDGWLFSGSDDCTVKIWRKNIGQSPHLLLATLRDQNWPVKTLALNSTGSVLYAGTSNGRIICWQKDRYSFTQMHHTDVLRGHLHAVLCLATMADSDLLFSGSADGTIMVWNRGMDSDVHTCLATIRTYGGPVQCIAATFEEKRGCLLFSGSLDGTVKMWRIIIKHSL